MIPQYRGKLIGQIFWNVTYCVNSRFILEIIESVEYKMGKRLNSKIYIIGSVASGKTTLARKLSILFDVPWYELDDVVYSRLPSGDVKRSTEERDFIFNQIIYSEKWIIEGVYRECFKSGFDIADTIILLNTSLYKRNCRILRRWIRQKLKLEKSGYAPTVKMLLSMYKWSNGFEKTKDDILKILEPYKNKAVIINDTSYTILEEKFKIS